MDAHLLGIDWGTSNRRAYLVDRAGTCLRRHADGQGLLAVNGDFAGALGYAGRGYALARPMANYVTARAAKKYASALGLASRTGEALPLAREAVALYEARYPPGYNELLDAQSVLGWLEALAGDVVAGRARAQSAYETLVASAGAQDSFAIEAKRRLDAIASARVEPAGGAPR